MLLRQSIAVGLVLGALALMGCGGSASSFHLPTEDASFSGEVFYNNKVDILFVVDNSKSMLQYQQRLSKQIDILTTTLNSLKMDYRVAVTTSTMASNTATYPMTRKLIGSPCYLTKENINLLASRLVPGESGSDLERSLDAMAYVTSKSYLSSIGSDFMRDGALFSVIFISDEQDQSNEFGNPNTNDFINYLNQRKPNFENGARAWLANYIGNLTSKSCDQLGIDPGVGTQFIKLVDESKGVKSSICNLDLSATVSNIKARIVDQITAYRFKEVPNKSTIKVTIGGTAVHEDASNGWTLETEVVAGKTNYLLRFHGTAIPAADQDVNVQYKPNGAT